MGDVLLAVDPSTTSTGLAQFVGRTLIWCGRVRVKGPLGLELSRQIAREAIAMVGYPSTLAIEIPQIYRASRSKGDPNNLLPVYGIAAALAALTGAEVHEYKPADWAGQVPKTTKHREAKTSRRGARIMSRLSPEEASLVPADHDVVDAVGIGLHHLGRFSRRRVYVGAT